MADDVGSPGFWNIVVGGLMAPLGFFLKQSFDRIGRLETGLAATRETLAKEYISKADMKNEMERVISRFDKLEEKIDKFIERSSR